MGLACLRGANDQFQSSDLRGMRPHNTPISTQLDQHAIQPPPDVQIRGGIQEMPRRDKVASTSSLPPIPHVAPRLCRRCRSKEQAFPAAGSCSGGRATATARWSVGAPTVTAQPLRSVGVKARPFSSLCTSRPAPSFPASPSVYGQPRGSLKMGENHFVSQTKHKRIHKP
jgi:hypothetical protein